MDPPTIEKRHRVCIDDGPVESLIGHTGPCPERDTTGFVVARNSHDQRVRFYRPEDGGVYAIDARALDTAASRGATVVFVYETDTGDVYEWPREAFVEPLPDEYADGTPQRCATRAEATHRWLGYGPDGLFRGGGDDGGDDVAGEGFTRASERHDGGAE